MNSAQCNVRIYFQCGRVYLVCVLIVDINHLITGETRTIAKRTLKWTRRNIFFLIYDCYGVFARHSIVRNCRIRAWTSNVRERRRGQPIRIRPRTNVIIGFDDCTLTKLRVINKTIIMSYEFTRRKCNEKKFNR